MNLNVVFECGESEKKKTMTTTITTTLPTKTARDDLREMIYN
jgi:hypothetical protein